MSNKGSDVRLLAVIGDAGDNAQGIITCQQKIISSVRLLLEASITGEVLLMHVQQQQSAEFTQSLRSN